MRLDMSDHNYESCSRCGGALLRISPPNNSPLIMRCQECGHEEGAVIDVPPSWPLEEGPKYVRVVVSRDGQAARAKELHALRKLSRELAELPLDDLAKQVSAAVEVDLGVYIFPQAVGLVEQATAYGLCATIKVLESDPIATSKVQRSFGFAAPVSVAEDGEDAVIIPFIWILLILLALAGLVLWWEL